MPWGFFITLKLEHSVFVLCWLVLCIIIIPCSKTIKVASVHTTPIINPNVIFQNVFMRPSFYMVNIKLHKPVDEGMQMLLPL